MIEHVILVRYGEIHLKGKNRPFFEKRLVDNMRGALRPFKGIRIERTRGRFFVRNYSPEDERRIMEALRDVFGILSMSPAILCEKEWHTICEQACRLMQEEVMRRGGACTFKVQSRRSDKSFPMTSMEMAPELGGIILDAVAGTEVDVKNPDVVLGLEIREQTYLYCEVIEGPGGIPTGSNGKATLLLSGGIDSPVAGHMMMKRGLEIECVHFYSFPYTSERAKEKVISLARKLARYCGHIRLHLVLLTDFQLAIHEKCPPEYATLLLRRGMMQIAERIAMEAESGALVTGEALGQVASQTLQSIGCTDRSVAMPVLRPCIGFDKIEIIHRAKQMNTYETSILPYEDCCTIFTPEHPATRPTHEKMDHAQQDLPEWDALLNVAFDTKEIMLLSSEETDIVL